MDWSKVLILPDVLLSLWHSHRTVLLLSTAIFLVCIRLVNVWRRGRPKASLTPPLGSPIDEKLADIVVNETSPGTRQYVAGAPMPPGSKPAKIGCHTCRARKRKCDERKPECGNCERGGFVCGGYGLMPVLSPPYLAQPPHLRSLGKPAEQYDQSVPRANLQATITERSKQTRCYTCISRGKECDLARPTCRNCEQGGFTCGGYGPQPDIDPGMDPSLFPGGLNMLRPDDHYANPIMPSHFNETTETSCLTCKVRKKKCDGAKPECRKCEKGGFACSGYGQQPAIDPHFQPLLSPGSQSRSVAPGPKRVTGVKKTKLSPQDAATSSIERIQPLIFYFSLGGSTKAYAEKLQRSLRTDDESKVSLPVLHDLTLIELDDYFISPPRPADPSITYFYLFLLPSYDISTELDRFLSHLQETHHDFRIDTSPLSGLAGYSVFGLGDGEGWPTERAGFCKDAVEVDKWMARLTGGKRAFPLGTADVKAGAVGKLGEWVLGVEDAMHQLLKGEGLGAGVIGSGEAVESGDEADIVSEGEDATSILQPQRKAIRRSRTADLEDIKPPITVDFTTSSTNSSTITSEPKPMVPVNSPTYTSLTKQGYTIVGSHSGVKICRWTKSALRGRGSCYKHSFYGIASHLCMEATPSLSCSNKCVFCWRHGTNPVGTTWRWTVDPPELVFAGMKEGHYKKIKMMKGVPGVRAERFQEAMKIRHCALSLVGEPIFYPHINRLLAMLHGERISSFLVCNAQHPDHLAALGKVTQLYVSIDASNKDSLKKIDRPLHRDFWERFLRCMEIIKARRWEQRTVFRLTLVKGFNIEDEAEGYADLVERALPGFVEVKGVTYCGTSTSQGAGLSMQNVPFYEEVTAFVLALENALTKRGLEYGIAAEHAHSCCILLADRTRFHRKSESDGLERWHTQIDYQKFFACLESGEAFGPEDYIGEPTPEWALWGNGGFDPRDERVDRKGRPVEVNG